MLKVVLDTNQFVSGLLTKKGPSAQLLQAWRKREYILITSNDILTEIERVLRYPHISKKYRLHESEIEALIELLEHEAVVLTDVIKLDVIHDDPDDNKILACAIASQANYVVSGDQHLLNLHKYQNIGIIAAREFLRILERAPNKH